MPSSAAGGPARRWPSTVARSTTNIRFANAAMGMNFLLARPQGFRGQPFLTIPSVRHFCLRKTSFGHRAPRFSSIGNVRINAVVLVGKGRWVSMPRRSRLASQAPAARSAAKLSTPPDAVGTKAGKTKIWVAHDNFITRNFAQKSVRAAPHFCTAR